MRINDRQTFVRAVETQKAQSTQAKTAATKASAADLMAQLSRGMGTQFVAAPPQARVNTQPLLPPKMSPPTDERLTRAVDTAFRQAFNGTKLPTGAQRSDLFNAARQMRAEGASAKQVETSLVHDILPPTSGGTYSISDNTLRQQIRTALQNNGMDASDGAVEARLGQARDMANTDHLSAQDVRFKLTDQFRAEKNGMNNTSDDTLRNQIRTALQQNGMDDSPAAVESHLNEARDMANKDHLSAQDIRFKLSDQFRAEKNGMNNTSDATLRNQIRTALQQNGMDDSPAAVESHLQEARDMANNDHLSAQDIRFKLSDQFRMHKSGMDNTSDDTLRNQIRTALQNNGMDSSDAAVNSHLQEARDMANNDHLSAQDIRFKLTDKFHMEKTGMGDTSPGTLSKLVDRAFATVLGQGRTPSPAEANAWFNFAQDLATNKKMSAQDIYFSLVDNLRTSRDNQ